MKNNEHCHKNRCHRCNFDWRYSLTVATIDYLADGNGRMDAFLQAEKRECPEDATLRGLFLDYVRKQTAEGKIITSKLDGRITVK